MFVCWRVACCVLCFMFYVCLRSYACALLFEVSSCVEDDSSQESREYREQKYVTRLFVDVF